MQIPIVLCLVMHRMVPLTQISMKNFIFLSFETPSRKFN